MKRQHEEDEGHGTYELLRRHAQGTASGAKCRHRRNEAGYCYSRRQGNVTKVIIQKRRYRRRHHSAPRSPQFSHVGADRLHAAPMSEHATVGRQRWHCCLSAVPRHATLLRMYQMEWGHCHRSHTSPRLRRAPGFVWQQRVNAQRKKCRSQYSTLRA